MLALAFGKHAQVLHRLKDLTVEGVSKETTFRESCNRLMCRNERYCLWAHAADSKMVGLNHDEIVASRERNGTSQKTTATLAFAKRVLDKEGEISDADLATSRNADFSEGETAEIIAHDALNVFTNYFNVATDVDIDFPKVSYTELA